MAPETDDTLVTALAWNLAIGLQSERHACRQMRAIAAIDPRPQIVVLTEARTALYDAYLSQLKARTGEAWHGVLQAHGSSGCWDGSSNSCSHHDDEAVLVATPLPIISSDTTLLPHADAWHSARAVVHAEIAVNGARVHVFATHLQAGIGARVADARMESIAMLTRWVAGFGAPAIVGGDFNALPDSTAIASTRVGMASAVSDTWQTCGSGAAATYPAWWPRRKIDYWFADSSGQARAVSTRVIRAVRLSDHLPLMARFEIACSPEARTSGCPDVKL